MSGWVIAMVAALAAAVLKTVVELARDEQLLGGADSRLRHRPAPILPVDDEYASDGLADQDGFRGRALIESEAGADGQPRDILVLQVRGVIPGAHEGWRGVFQVGAIDASEPEQGTRPVRCTIAELTTPGTHAFQYRSADLSFGEMTWLDGWATLVRVPLDALVFARPGARRLCVFFGVGAADDPDALRCHDEVVVAIAPTESPSPEYLASLRDCGQDSDANTAELAGVIQSYQETASPC